MESDGCRFLLSNVYKKRFEFRWDYLNFAFLKIE
jgi:hypothetical protein